MPEYKREALLSLALLAAMVVTTMALLNGQDRNKPASTINEEATLVQEGKLAEKQKAHSKLYKQYVGRRNISELVARPGDLKIVVKNEPEPVAIQNLTCESDAMTRPILFYTPLPAARQEK